MPLYSTLRIAAFAAAITVLSFSVAEPSPGEPFDLRVNFATCPMEVRFNCLNSSRSSMTRMS